MAWHDSNLSAAFFSGRDNSWAVRSNESNTWSVFDVCNRLHHVEGWDSFCNTDDDSFTFDGVKGIRCLHNCLCSKRWRDVNDGGISIGCFDGFTHAVPHWERFSLEFNGLTAFTGSAPTNDVSAVFDHLVCMEHALLSSDSLHQYFRIFFNPN